MLVKTKCEHATTKRFKAKLKPYHHHFDKCSKAVKVHHGRPKEGKVRLGDLVTIPDSDLHHVMDHAAMMAIGHAIEDIASDEGQGELIATFQNFDNFLPHKKRYREMAERLDAVRVWGSGEVPKACGNIDFVQVDEKLLRYWLVLFDSEHSRAVLLCKQMNKATELSEKKFLGFYSFNPYLVQSIRWRFNMMSCGLTRVISHWEKAFPFPDLKMKDLDRMIRQPDAVDI